MSPRPSSLVPRIAPAVAAGVLSLLLPLHLVSAPVLLTPSLSHTSLLLYQAVLATASRHVHRGHPIPPGRSSQRLCESLSLPASVRLPHSFSLCLINVQPFSPSLLFCASPHIKRRTFRTAALSAMPHPDDQCGRVQQ
eukprot:325864-Chlamydomonas_euryale.AAC.3